jgi:hypothetical protein
LQVLPTTPLVNERADDHDQRDGRPQRSQDAKVVPPSAPATAVTPSSTAAMTTGATSVDQEGRNDE